MSQEDILVSPVNFRLHTNRRYLGKGCSLIADDGDVWILNQSESSIFVQVIGNFRILYIFKFLFRVQFVIYFVIGTRLQL